MKIKVLEIPRPQICIHIPWTGLKKVSSSKMISRMRNVRSKNCWQVSKTMRWGLSHKNMKSQLPIAAENDHFWCSDPDSEVVQSASVKSCTLISSVFQWCGNVMSQFLREIVIWIVRERSWEQNPATWNRFAVEDIKFINNIITSNQIIVRLYSSSINKGSYSGSCGIAHTTQTMVHPPRWLDLTFALCTTSDSGIAPPKMIVLCR